jgi:hypothetical protein
MKRRIFHLLAAFIATFALAEEGKDARPTVLVVRGAGGEPRFEEEFVKVTAEWQRAAELAGARCIAIADPSAKVPARTRIQSVLETEPKDGAQELWVVLTGHGTADAKDAKFNLPGDDLSVTDLAAWLKPFRRPVIVVCGFSASGAWLKPLAAPDRIVLTATKSGAENNYSRFASRLSAALTDPAADIDKDGETSLLEAWLTAARKVADFYKDEGRLATEHSLLDDTGDGTGTQADWFTGIRLTKRPKDGVRPDGLRASQVRLIRSAAELALTPEQRVKRDALERDLAALRDRKAGMKEEDYLRELEALLLQLARIYQGGS